MRAEIMTKPSILTESYHDGNRYLGSVRNNSTEARPTAAILLIVMESHPTQIFEIV